MKEREKEGLRENESLHAVTAGPLGVGARVVRGLPSEVPLPEEQPDWGDQDRHSVPLPLLAGRQHSHLHQGDPGV